MAKTDREGVAIETTANLDLPYIMPSQAQKHVTYNEAIRRMDALVQLAVLDRDSVEPPASPADGARYLVPADATGAWTGKDGDIAAWQDSAWEFLTPNAGWVLWIGDEEHLVVHDGTEWRDIGSGGLNPAAMVGVNAVADLTNRLSVRSPSVLFDEEDGDHRLMINKADTDDTASLIFLTGHSAKAEFGLTGDDDWHVKVSADGESWIEALNVDMASGRVSLPGALPLLHDDQVATKRHIRDRLTANLALYVRTDGSDSNDGLADTSGGAFLTIQAALDFVLGTLDLGGYDVTINVAPGTYPGAISFASAQVGAGKVTLSGDTTTPANVTVGNITVDGAGCRLFFQGLNVAKGTGAYCVNVRNGGYAKTTGKNRFSSTSGGHRILLENFASADFVAAEEIQGTVAGGHYFVQNNSVLYCQGASWAAIGSAAQGTFAYSQTGGVIFAFVNTSSGTFTGARYSVTLNGVIQTNGGGASYFPGNSAGSTATGGQYA
ncbi:MAG: DUF2793 domain-containing protein [Rhizobiaceae bacterium]|nr:DUF2793 domain-containing protein [Rhizobiaceae bacterium]